MDDDRVVGLGDLRARLATEWHSQEIIEEKRRACRRMITRLNAPEASLLEKLAKGWSEREIAQFLDLTLADLEALRITTFEKVGARSTSDAVRVAIYAGLD